MRISDWSSDVCSSDLAHGGAQRGILARRGDADAVHRRAGARRDQAADDDILLEAHQRVDLALHRRLGEYAGRFLEGRRRDEAARLQARLGVAEEDWAAFLGLRAEAHTSELPTPMR